MSSIEILIIVFLSLLFIAICIFSMFFLCYQYLLRHEFKIKNRFNELSMIIAAVSFAKIEVISQNNIILQDKLIILKNNFEKLKANNNILKDAIKDYSIQNKRMNMRACFNQLKKLISDLNILSNQYDDFSAHSCLFTQYSENICAIFNSYRDIYLVIEKFYKTNIAISYNFTQFEELTQQIKVHLFELDELSVTFNFDDTVSAIINLRKELLTFFSYCQRVYTLKRIRAHIDTNIDNVNRIINNNYDKIANNDFENITKLIALTNDYQKKFITSFESFLLKEAYDHSVSLLINIEQLNNFIFLSLNSINLIKETTNVINREISQIINNKANISQQLNILINYFNEDSSLQADVKVINDNFKEIINNFNVVNTYQSKSYVEKKTHLEKIDSASQKINVGKQKIIVAINTINESIKDGFELIQKINNLSFILYQLQCHINLYKTANSDENILLADNELINMLLLNLKEIQQHVLIKEDLTRDEIDVKLEDINNQVGILVQKINTSYVLSNYSHKLLTYANRFITNEQTKLELAAIEKEIIGNNYFKALDMLLDFINKNSKN